MLLQFGTRVRVIKNYLEGFFNIPVGTEGTITGRYKPGEERRIVKVSFDNGFDLVWMVTDGHGDTTLEVVSQPKPESFLDKLADGRLDLTGYTFYGPGKEKL